MVYPREHFFYRIKAIKNMSSHDFISLYVSDKRFKKIVQEVNKTLGLIKKNGGPVEIYIGKLLHRTAKTVRGNGEPFTDQALLEQFMTEHFIIHIHEVLHKMWHWESTFGENRKRGRIREEMTVKDLSLWIRNIMYVKQPWADKCWEQFCKKYRMLSKKWKIAAPELTYS